MSYLAASPVRSDQKVQPREIELVPAPVTGARIGVNPFEICICRGTSRSLCKTPYVCARAYPTIVSAMCHDDSGFCGEGGMTQILPAKVSKCVSLFLSKVIQK